MKRIFLVLLLSSILFPLTFSYSQTTDLPPTLSVTLSNNSPFMYKDSEGHAVVVGLVENNDNLSAVSNVQVMVSFFDETSPSPIEVTYGPTLLEVIPPNGKSPYLISSESTNPNITSTEVKLVDFSSSVSKEISLEIELIDSVLTQNLKFSGILHNNGNAPNLDTKVHVAFYDAFIPPRIIGVSTIEVGDLGIDAGKTFEFNQAISPRAVGMLLVAESDVFTSKVKDVKIPNQALPTRKVEISDVYVADVSGKPLSKIEQGSTVKIQAKSWIQLITQNDSEQTPYTFYAQVKQSGEIAFVEFLGMGNGTFMGTQQEFPSITWIPQQNGVFFIETFVWDRDGVPLADPGPVIIVVVS